MCANAGENGPSETAYVMPPEGNGDDKDGNRDKGGRGDKGAYRLRWFTPGGETTI